MGVGGDVAPVCVLRSEEDAESPALSFSFFFF